MMYHLMVYSERCFVTRNICITEVGDMKMAEEIFGAAITRAEKPVLLQSP